ncbi:MAG: site-specific integrase [Pseudonocardiales bacterium]|nr:MAG: site-specific integrase [Pseudonocardiales bacterium]
MERLPSGSLRVRVYAGVDPLTGKRHYLTEVIPLDPGASREGVKAARDEAKKALTRLVNQIDERRNPRTRATVDQLLDRYLELLDVEPTTLRTYRFLMDKHIRPVIGPLMVARLDGEVIDSLYARLRACRDHCDGRRYTDHRTVRPHECDHRCGPHLCRPLTPSSVRQVHWILSGALKRAVRWRWIGYNPISEAQPPSPTRPDPRPPSEAEAARILTEASTDPDWATFIWLAMTTGARRGELCGLRWHNLDLDTGAVTLRTSIAQDGNRRWEKDTKTHQQRRVAIDADTVEVLAAHRTRCVERAAQLGLDFSADAFMFSLSPDGSTHLVPSSVSQRFAKLAERLGLRTHLHQLRHYSATELIAAGVDVRTVAGRLGHSGGGTTTLRVYAAWKAEVDQRAADTLGVRLPHASRPGAVAPRPKVPSPYERIAAELRRAIREGELRPGDRIPTLDGLAAKHGVSVGTAHRAVALLFADGLVAAHRGRRTIVIRNSG